MGATTKQDDVGKHEEFARPRKRKLLDISYSTRQLLDKRRNIFDMKLGLGLGSAIFKQSVEVDGTKYAILNTIGEGGFAFVYRVKKLSLFRGMGGGGDESDKHFALKKMICQTEEQEEEAAAEIAVLRAVVHPNILPLLGHSRAVNRQRQTEISLLLPLYEGTVQSLIDAPTCKGFPHCPFSSSADVISVLKGTLAGLQALHAAGYRHNDLKPANILLQWERGKGALGNNKENGTLIAILTDFGSTGPLVVDITSRRIALDIQDWHASHSTASIRAPELMDPPSSGLTLDGRADIWSMGATLFAMLFCRTPFESPIEGFSSLAALAGSYTVPAGHPWEESIEALLSRCLQPILDNRANLEQLIAMTEALPPPPVSLTHVFPPKPINEEMPMWDGELTAGISYKSANSKSTRTGTGTGTGTEAGREKGSPSKPHVTAAPAVAVDWGDAGFEADFTAVVIPPLPPASSMSEAFSSSETSEPVVALTEDFAVEFEPFSLADTGAGAVAVSDSTNEEGDKIYEKGEEKKEGEDDDDDDFGDFTGSAATERRKSERYFTSPLSLAPPIATATSTGVDPPTKLSSPTSASNSLIPRTAGEDRDRLRSLSGEAESEEGEGRLSDWDEFGDNAVFERYSMQATATSATAAAAEDTDFGDFQ